MRPPLNILIHGEPKTGKTTFAVRRNPGVLILDTEGSSRFVRGVERRNVTTLGEIDAVLSDIKAGKVKLVVIDTIDELVNGIAHNYVRKLGGENVKRDGKLSMQGYGTLRDRFLTMSREFRDAGADVLTLCHSQLVEISEGVKKFTMQLPSDYAKQVMGQMDVIGFMEKYRKPDGEYGYRTNFQKTPLYDAGCRAIYDAATDKFYEVIPKVMDDSSLVDVLKSYSDFYDGKDTGYPTVCDHCHKEAEVKEAGNGKTYCAECMVKYEEHLNKSNQANA